MLVELEFTSERARSSVVTRSPDGTLRLFCKGSDAVMLSRIREDTDAELLDATDGHLHAFSVKGLRTLVIATKVGMWTLGSRSRFTHGARFRVTHDTSSGGSRRTLDLRPLKRRVPGYRQGGCRGSDRGVGRGVSVCVHASYSGKKSTLRAECSAVSASALSHLDPGPQGPYQDS